MCVMQLNLSYNRLQVLSIPYLCLPNLEKLNVSHNNVHAIDDKGKVCVCTHTHIHTIYFS